MHRQPRLEPSPAQRRLGPWHVLVLLLLACCLWSGSQAQARPGAAASGQLASASAGADAQLVAPPPACAQAGAAHIGGVDPVCNDVADPEALAPLHRRIARAQTVWPQNRQPVLQQAERQPLLRPPTRLG